MIQPLNYTKRVLIDVEKQKMYTSRPQQPNDVQTNPQVAIGYHQTQTQNFNKIAGILKAALKDI